MVIFSFIIVFLVFMQWVLDVDREYAAERKKRRKMMLLHLHSNGTISLSQLFRKHL